MQLEHLNYFLAAIEHGSINKAAKALYCTQPTITTAIKSIEKELGAQIVERTATGISLTPLGKAVWADAQLMFSYIDSWKERADTGNKTSTVNLQLSGAYQRFPVICSIMKFRKKYPEIPLHIESSTYSSSPHAGNIRYRIVLCQKTPQHLILEKEYAESHGMNIAIIQNDEFKLFASADNELINRSSINLSDLSGKRVFLIQNPFSFPYVEMLKDVNCILEAQMWHEDSIMSALSLDHETFAIRPSLAAVHNYYIENSLIRMRSFDDISMPTYHCVIYPNAQRITDTERLFIEHLSEEFPDFQNA